MKPLRVLSLFDGISVGQLALERAGIPVEVYYASEIDKYAIAITQKNYPNTIQIGDVEKVDFTQYEGKIDLLIGGSPCFVADTLVMTNNGFKPIQDIKVGDYVLTHKSRYKKVLAIGNKVVDTVYKIKGMGFDEIFCTRNHPFYTRQMYRKWSAKDKRSTRRFTSPEWVSAIDLKPFDYISSTYNTENNMFNIPNEYLSEDFWYFVGRFVGDGWCTKVKRKHRKNSYLYQTRLCCGKQDYEEVKNIIDKLGYNYCVIEERTVFKFQLSRKSLLDFLQLCGHGAENKKVHPLLWKLPLNYKKAFLEGYLSADGCLDKKRNILSATSISRELIYGLKQLVMEVYGVCPQICKPKLRKEHIIEGRKIKQKQIYSIKFAKEIRKQNHAFQENKIAWYPYKTTEEIQGFKLVYNLEVEEDNSYTANTMIVHNCQSFSIAGKREEFEGESRLFYEYVRAIKECKPKYFFLENVESMSERVKEIISKEMGCYPTMINSSLLSAQNRKRYYWFNWGDMQYNLFGFPTCDIPQPKDKGILLKDVLESGIADREKTGALCATDYKGFGYNAIEYMSKHQRCNYVAEPIRLSQYEKSQGQAQRVYSVRGKSVALNANGGGQGGKTGLYKIDLPDGDYIIRKLTPIECERLQTMPDNFTQYGKNEKGEVIEISNSQRYKCIGNSWTADVIAYIFSFLKEELNEKGQAQALPLTK